MKVIVAVIQPTRLRALTEALARVEVTRFTVFDALEFSDSDDQVQDFPGQEAVPDMLRKVSLEIAVNDDFLESAVDIIVNVARTGHGGADGDGKVFILPLDDAIHFFPEQRGKSAI